MAALFLDAVGYDLADLGPDDLEPEGAADLLRRDGSALAVPLEEPFVTAVAETLNDNARLRWTTFDPQVVHGDMLLFHARRESVEPPWSPDQWRPYVQGHLETHTYFVITNHENQHSLWTIFADVPDGWKIGHGEDTRQGCLDHIEKNWTDMWPQSLIEAMRETGG